MQRLSILPQCFIYLLCFYKKAVHRAKFELLTYGYLPVLQLQFTALLTELSIGNFKDIEI